MIERLDEAELIRIQRDQVVIAQSIGEIFDRAIAKGDQITLGRIIKTYPRGYLDEIIGGYPDYLYLENELNGE